MTFAPLRLVHDEPVPLPESASQHLRNVLQLVRCCLDLGEPLLGNGSSHLAVSVETLDAIQRRVETALELLELPPESL